MKEIRDATIYFLSPRFKLKAFAKLNSSSRLCLTVFSKDNIEPLAVCLTTEYNDIYLANCSNPQQIAVLKNMMENFDTIFTTQGSIDADMLKRKLNIDIKCRMDLQALDVGYQLKEAVKNKHHACQLTLQYVAAHIKPHRRNFEKMVAKYLGYRCDATIGLGDMSKFDLATMDSTTIDIIKTRCCLTNILTDELLDKHWALVDNSTIYSIMAEATDKQQEIYLKREDKTFEGLRFLKADD